MYSRYIARNLFASLGYSRALAERVAVAMEYRRTDLPLRGYGDDECRGGSVILAPPNTAKLALGGQYPFRSEFYSGSNYRSGNR